MEGGQKVKQKNKKQKIRIFPSQLVISPQGLYKFVF